VDGKSIKAGALLEKARLVIPANEELWVESVGVEEHSSGLSQAKAMLSKALQERPTSGLLWSLALWAEARASRKTKSVDALRKTKDSPIVVCAVARVLWADRVIERAREWFGRATATDPDRGDIWGCSRESMARGAEGSSSSPVY
jgi:pre-mRNA-processing factor 6